MQYQHFIGCKNEEEVRTKYKSLVKTTHPDVQGGSHQAFTSLKNEYDHILDGKSLFPIQNNQFVDLEDFKDFHREQPKETVTHLTPEEIATQRITAYFTKLRTLDETAFNQIDAIVKEGTKANTKKLWMYQEVQKLDDLTLDHFKYLTWVLGDAVSVAQVFYKKYSLRKVA